MIKSTKLTPEEIEADRQHDLLEAQQTFPDSNLNERFGPASIGHYEMTDRTYIFCEMFDYVLRSPSTILDPDLYAHAAQIQQDLYDFYQAAALKEWEAEEKEEKKPDDKKIPSGFIEFLKTKNDRSDLDALVAEWINS